MNSDLLYTLALTYIPKIGPINQRKILALADSKLLWNLSKKEQNEIFRGRKDIIQHLQSSECLDLAQKELDFCAKYKIDVLLHSSERYPEKLKNCVDSPLVLFKKGSHEFNQGLYIAVVGTRKMTAYGKKFIETLIHELSNHKMTIVSGLAYGCDIEAHRASIQNQMPNIAVLAHGLNRISPSIHKKEARELQQNGALVSEYSTFHNAEPMNFVVRNRIIAGISDAVIVVESDQKGGALATAQYAGAYNREVFALPGRTDDKYSLGCNHLIQSNQAYMIRKADDLLHYFNLKVMPKPVATQLFIELDAEEKLIYEYLKTNGRQQVDSISTALKIPIFSLNTSLLNLELKGAIKAFSGKFYGIN